MRSFAIIVGINAYPSPTGQEPLAGAVADACDFAEWALDPAGGNVAPADLFFWTYPWAEPTPGRLRDYLNGNPPTWDHEIFDRAPPDQTRPPVAREIVYTIERAGRESLPNPGQAADPRRAYVFLAGHGLRAIPYGALTEETCFLAADFRPMSSNLAAGLVACESLRWSLLNRRFDDAIFFLDCCRLKTSKLTMKAVPLADQAGDKVLPFAMAFAAQDNEPAFETTTEPIRGAFSATLMAGLRSCREGDEPALTTARLREYVITNISTHTTTGQRPNVFFRPDDDHGPVIVKGGIAPAPAAAAQLQPGPLAILDALLAGTQVVLKDGQGNPVAGFPLLEAGHGPIALPPLPDGLYSLEVVDDRSRFEMFRHPGKEVVRVL